jgi:hypothetical protein
MQDEKEFMASALATTFIVRELLHMLVRKRALSKKECADVMDLSLLKLEEQQNEDVPENAEVWDIARRYVGYLIRSEEKVEVETASD